MRNAIYKLKPFEMNSMMYLVFVFIISIGTEINTQYLPCTVNVLSSSLKFTLFNRQNQDTGVALNDNTYSSVDTNNLTTLIIHGYLQDDTKLCIRLMKDTYLNKSADNIILIDWSPYSGPDYHQAACAVSQVGKFVGDLIYNLIQVGVNVGKVQIIGFSLGAHIAGDAGQRVYALSNSKVSRICGLDAANPEFYGKPIAQRLDSSDAVFVQAIHTNNNGYGYPLNYGTIDFHVNEYQSGCGIKQSGCPMNPGIPNDDSPLLNGFCDHYRSCVYYIESISSDRFVGVQCDSCSNFRSGSCNSNPKTIMGEMCPFDQSGVKYLYINSVAPFAQG